jgi:hypothetical protein
MCNSPKLKLCLLATLALLCAACSSELPGRPVNHTAKSPLSSQTEPAWVNSPQKHNNSGISMRYRIDGEMAVGKPVMISLEFAGATATDASVLITPPAGLAVGMLEGLQLTKEGYVIALAAGEITARTVSFTPYAEGEHFIGFRLAQNGRGSAAGIMLRLGSKVQEKASPGKIVTTESGEKLLVMPAK